MSDSILQVNQIKDKDGNATGLSIASDGQVTIEQNNPTIQLGSNATGFTGIKNIDNWHLNNNITGSFDPIPYNNYTRASSSSGGANLGTGMDLHDVSGDGVFTFPVTGIWRIESRFQHVLNGDTRYIFNRTKLSTTGKSGSFSTIVEGSSFIQRTSTDTTYTQVISHAILDVTTAGDTGSSFALRFQISAVSNIITIGQASVMKSGHTFTRLADT